MLFFLLFNNSFSNFTESLSKFDLLLSGKLISFNDFFSELTLNIDKSKDFSLVFISSNSEEAFSLERTTSG